MRDCIRHFQPFHQPVGQRGIEIHLQEQRDGNQCHMQRLAADILRLKRKDQNQCCEQRDNGNGGERGRKVFSNQSLLWLRINHCRSNTPMVNGITIKASTE